MWHTEVRPLIRRRGTLVISESGKLDCHTRAARTNVAFLCYSVAHVTLRLETSARLRTYVTLSVAGVLRLAALRSALRGVR